ncbi:exodeoxyribonuclease VII large subunit [Aminipila butyrica]|uniref:Exodeoxyribonuclease 7 large subunit n=1 Tax=Aminipila butyrica TaxID=433296 RepID=A0A858BWD0_9FIRM|nr:exodeoxyribonuclease VII large subunit [Aminipila butyrica]QIB69408.1 exodeoxyribonuclease VII large subunit [Aminipila butyrica]
MAIKPIKVSQLNAYIKRVLQSDPLLGGLSVIGEVSNLKFHGTGHVYFTLKDATSKINCFLPAENAERLHFELADGMEVTAEGYIYLYEKGGTYSLNIRDIQVSGLGNLSIAFEKLKEKLAREGLFDEKHKKPLPFFPRKIAVITSESGAAVRDIIKIIKTRNNIVDVLVYPVLVQGPAAAPEIAEAIRQVNHLFPDTDTIITGRGGGSMEELWAFNEEMVARSIFESRIPIISAVGHEIDFTIADFVADKRAETPTAAAQMAVPDVRQLKAGLAQLRGNLEHRMSSLVKSKELALQSCNIQALASKLENRIHLQQLSIGERQKEMFTHMGNLIYNKRNRIDALRDQLEALNPRKVMERGYSIITDQKGNVIQSIENLQPGDSVIAAVKDGSFAADVTEIRKDK